LHIATSGHDILNDLKIYVFLVSPDANEHEHLRLVLGEMLVDEHFLVIIYLY
jgi:hypothetical protein